VIGSKSQWVAPVTGSATVLSTPLLFEDRSGLRCGP
jgi:hypothetical protein